MYCREAKAVPEYPGRFELIWRLVLYTLGRRQVVNTTEKDRGQDYASVAVWDPILSQRECDATLRI